MAREVYRRRREKLLGQQPYRCAFRKGIDASPVKLLDSCTMTLRLNIFPWAGYSEEKGAVKLHTPFSFNDFLPVDVFVSDGKMSDNDGAYHVLPGRLSIVVADRGYDDTRLRRDWDSMGVTFEVRLRRDIKFRRTDAIEQPDDREQDILVDEVIRLTGDDTARQYPHPLRRVVVYRPYDSTRRKASERRGEDEPSSEHTIELETNNGTWNAETISALYKARWQIESFFKAHQAEPVHQILCGAQQERCHVANLDRHDNHPHSPVPQEQGEGQLAHVKPDCHHKEPPDEPSGFVGLVTTVR